MRSVDDQFSPSINGGMPVLATSCSRICRTGTSLSSIMLSAPMTRMSTSPHAHKVAHMLPSRVSCIAPAHSWRQQLGRARAASAPSGSSPCGL